MDSEQNSKPLLDQYSDSEDVNDDLFEGVRHRTADSASGSRQGHSSHSDINDSDTHDIRDLESNTDDFDDDTQQLFKPTNVVPNDRFSFTYMVFYFLGTTTLLPWNFFITAEDYWMYKFRNVTSNSSTEITPIQATFTSDLTFSASIPSTMFLILNALYGYKVPLNVRMIGSLVITMVFFAANTALIEVNTDQWQDKFFDITILSVVIMNIATAILSGGLFGICGQFPSEYVTAVVSGQALGGVFTAIIEIITITFSSDPKGSAIIFFAIGNIMLVLSLIAYITMSRTEFFRHFTIDKENSPKNSHSHLQRQTTLTPPPVFREVLNKMWLYGFTEWLVFVVTLSVYPSVTVLINSQSHGNGHPWNDVYFIPVTNYLIFNSGDYLGRILAGLFEWPNNKPHVVAILSMLRIAFLPALLLCNTNPRHHVPVLIHSDYIFILLMCFFAFTNGYLANIAMVWAPKCVNHREREMASSIMAAFLGIGIAFGSSLSLIIVQLI